MINEAKSPQEVKAELSRRIDSLITELFPLAKRASGGRYSMGNFKGDKGYSCSVYKSRNGVYLAKDHETDESINILELVHRHLGGSFSSTMRWVHTWLGYTQIRTIKTSEPVKVLSVKDEAIRGSEVAKYMLDERKINERTLNKFRIFQEKSATSTWWATPLYDESENCRMIKYTSLQRDGKSKKIWSSKPVFNTAFGLHLVDPDDTKLIICEGEIDAMSVYQMQKEDRIPVISVPSASNHAWIENCYDMLATQKIIYICSDMDQAGQAMFLTLSKRLGVDRCKRLIIPTPYNDANDWWVQGSPSEEDFQSVLDKSQEQQSESLVKPNQYIIQLQDCITRQEQERDWKNWIFQEMDLSIRQSELFCLSGKTGSGKSALSYQIANFLADNDQPLLFASFEIPIESIMLELAHQRLGRPPLHEECGEMADILGKNMYFIDDKLMRDSRSNWHGLKEEIILAKKKYGISSVIVDSYTFLSPKMDWEFQGIISKDLARTCVQNEISLILNAHEDAKNKETGGGKYPATGPGNILGAQELSQASHTICNIHRNTQKEMAVTDDDKRKFAKQGDALFSVFKQRNSGAIFTKDLWFDPKTRMFQTSPITNKI